MAVVVDVEVDPRDATLFFLLMIRRPPRSTLDRSSAASDVYKRQRQDSSLKMILDGERFVLSGDEPTREVGKSFVYELSLIHISEPTRPY
mgnify:CR=1 FL=1